jgi:hypothetical protein
VEAGCGAGLDECDFRLCIICVNSPGPAGFAGSAGFCASTAAFAGPAVDDGVVVGAGEGFMRPSEANKSSSGGALGGAAMVPKTPVALDGCWFSVSLSRLGSGFPAGIFGWSIHRHPLHQYRALRTLRVHGVCLTVKTRQPTIHTRLAALSENVISEAPTR